MASLSLPSSHLFSSPSPSSTPPPPPLRLSPLRFPSLLTPSFPTISHPRRRISLVVKASDSRKKTSTETTDTSDDEEEEQGEEIYDWPPLICCFGEAINEFVSTVRVSNRRSHPDMYSKWKILQWTPPEFARILSGSSFNVAIALARQGCRVAFMGKVGDDAYGKDLVHRLNVNKVQTRGVRFDSQVKTGISFLNLTHENGEAKMSCVEPSAENSFTESDINEDILKESQMLHFTSSILTLEPIRSSLFSAVGIIKKYGGGIFFDVNLTLPLWISREHTWSIIKDAWQQANFIEVTKHELEFLLGEENCKRRPPQYAANSEKELRVFRDEYHYKRKEIAPIWHDNLKLLIVLDGTYVIHYYTPGFDGEVLGVEDVLVAPDTCDRAGSADAMVGAIMRKLNLHPELYKDEETLPKALRYALCAGIIAQWSIGSTKGLPTESASQNLTEQLYRPVFVQPLGNEIYARRPQEYLL